MKPTSTTASSRARGIIAREVVELARIRRQLDRLGAPSTAEDTPELVAWMTALSLALNDLPNPKLWRQVNDLFTGHDYQINLIKTMEEELVRCQATGKDPVAAVEKARIAYADCRPALAAGELIGAARAIEPTLSGEWQAQIEHLIHAPAAHDLGRWAVDHTKLFGRVRDLLPHASTADLAEAKRNVLPGAAYAAYVERPRHSLKDWRQLRTQAVETLVGDLKQEADGAALDENHDLIKDFLDQEQSGQDQTELREAIFNEAGLSPAERAIARRTAAGESVEHIAVARGTTASTVRVQLANVRTKLRQRARNRAQTA
jgi:DNA-binding CsgD family transcriptional regulator